MECSVRPYGVDEIIEEEVEVHVLLGVVQNQEEHANVQLGGDEEQQKD